MLVQLQGSLEEGRERRLHQTLRRIPACGTDVSTNLVVEKLKCDTLRLVIYRGRRLQRPLNILNRGVHSIVPLVNL